MVGFPFNTLGKLSAGDLKTDSPVDKSVPQGVNVGSKATCSGCPRESQQLLLIWVSGTLFFDRGLPQYQSGPRATDTIHSG